ncbi:MAG: glycosyltransferase [Planctomycetes bacterium]|nr:glycosyltransferase [Planctomycetota bacterium]
MSAISGLRIGIVTPRLELVGGTETYLHRLLALQATLGAKVATFTRQDVELGESIHPLHRPSAHAVAESAERIAAACDVVEIHGCSPLPLMRALHGRVPMLLYQHTSESTCPAGGRSLPVSGGICERPAGIGCLGVDTGQRCLCLPDGTRFPLLQRVKAPLRPVLARQAMNLAWGMVFNSHALESLFARTVGVPGRSHVLHPMLPDHFPAPQARRHRSLFFSGRLYAFKGVTDAIAVCAALRGSTLTIAGDGPELAPARRQAERMNVADRVHFAGWLDEPGLAAHAASSQCLLMPARVFEAWGMAGPEAVAMGCDVVAFDAGGIREWCRTPWGEIVEHGNTQALARAAARRIDQPAPEAVRQDWAQQARDLWGPAAFARAYAPILLRAAERAAARRVVSVLHLERKPQPGFHSIENLFATIRRNLPGDIEPRVARSPHSNGGILRRLGNLIWAGRQRADVIHVVGDSHYLVLATPPGRTVLTIHDCAPLVRSGGLRRRLLRWAYFLRPMARAAVTTTVSEKSRQELHDLAGADPAAVRVVPNCVSQAFTSGPGAHGRDVLAVGTLEHKNLRRVARSLAGTGLALRVIGPLDDALRAQLTAAGTPFTQTQGLDEAAMAEAYRSAGVLAFVSMYEGFGMPILEAQACGLPVVTSARAPMDWVAGNGALLIDPTDESAIRAGLLAAMDDEQQRRQLVEAGLLNVQRFAPAAIAAHYAAIYRELADKPENQSMVRLNPSSSPTVG